MTWPPPPLLLLPLLALLATPASARFVSTHDVTPCAVEALAPSDKALLCYYEGRLSVYQLDPCLCTHIVFKDAAVVSDNFGLKIVSDVSGAPLLRARSPSLRAVLGLRLSGAVARAALASPSRRLALARDAARRLYAHHLDAIEVSVDDEEAAAAADAAPAATARQGLVALLKALRTALDAHGREKRDYLVSESVFDDFTTQEYEPTWSDGSSRKSRRRATSTTTTTSTTESPEETAARYLELERDAQNAQLLLSLPTRPETVAKRYDVKNITRYVDYIVLRTQAMTDDSERGLVYHPSRLMGLDDMLNADAVVDLVTSLGASPSQLVITLPGQATAFELRREERTEPRSPATGAPRTISQPELCRALSRGNWTLERDEDQTAPYAYSGRRWIAFDDALSASIKGKYAVVRGLGGTAVDAADALDWQGTCGAPASQLRALHGALAQLRRTSRGALLQGLEEDLHAVPQLGFTGDVRLSQYRITRVVDTEGVVHVLRRDVETHFQCSRQGYYAHPLGCNRFYRCVKFNQYARDFTVFEYDCPEGLAFDERWEVCVWPGSLPRGAPCSGSSEIAPVPRLRYACPRAEGYYADPENCRWFFACLDHARDGATPLTAYEFRCPFGLVFDESRLLCDWPWKVDGCGRGGGSLLVGAGPTIVYEQADVAAGRHIAPYASLPDYLVSGGRAVGTGDGVVLGASVGLAGVGYGAATHAAALYGAAAASRAAAGAAAASRAAAGAAALNQAAAQAAAFHRAAAGAAAANEAAAQAAAINQAAAHSAVINEAAARAAAVNQAAAQSAAINQAAAHAAAANQAAAQRAAINQAAAHAAAINQAAAEAAAINDAAVRSAAANQAAAQSAAINQAAAHAAAVNQAAAQAAAINQAAAHAAAANQAAAQSAAINQAAAHAAAVNQAAAQAAAINDAAARAAAANRAAAQSAAINQAAAHAAAVNQAAINEAAARAAAANQAAHQQSAAIEASRRVAANAAAAQQAAVNAAAAEKAANRAAAYNAAAANQAALDQASAYNQAAAIRNSAARVAVQNQAANEAALRASAYNQAAAGAAAANQAALNQAAAQAAAANEAAAQAAAVNQAALQQSAAIAASSQAAANAAARQQAVFEAYALLQAEANRAAYDAAAASRASTGVPVVGAVVGNIPTVGVRYNTVGYAPVVKDSAVVLETQARRTGPAVIGVATVDATAAQQAAANAAAAQEAAAAAAAQQLAAQQAAEQQAAAQRAAAAAQRAAAEAAARQAAAQRAAAAAARQAEAQRAAEEQAAQQAAAEAAAQQAAAQRAAAAAARQAAAQRAAAAAARQAAAEQAAAQQLAAQQAAAAAAAQQAAAQQAAAQQAEAAAARQAYAQQAAAQQAEAAAARQAYAQQAAAQQAAAEQATAIRQAAEQQAALQRTAAAAASRQAERQRAYYATAGDGLVGGSAYVSQVPVVPTAAYTLPVTTVFGRHITPTYTASTVAPAVPIAPAVVGVRVSTPATPLRASYLPPSTVAPVSLVSQAVPVAAVQTITPAPVIRQRLRPLAPVTPAPTFAQVAGLVTTPAPTAFEFGAVVTPAPAVRLTPVQRLRPVSTVRPAVERVAAVSYSTVAPAVLAAQAVPTGRLAQTYSTVAPAVAVGGLAQPYSTAVPAVQTYSTPAPVGIGNGFVQTYSTVEPAVVAVTPPARTRLRTRPQQVVQTYTAAAPAFGRVTTYAAPSAGVDLQLLPRQRLRTFSTVTPVPTVAVTGEPLAPFSTVAPVPVDVTPALRLRPRTKQVLQAYSTPAPSFGAVLSTVTSAPVVGVRVAAARGQGARQYAAAGGAGYASAAGARSGAARDEVADALLDSYRPGLLSGRDDFVQQTIAKLSRTGGVTSTAAPAVLLTTARTSAAEEEGGVRRAGSLPPDTPVVVVSRVSDANPLLVAKLGAQCVCREPQVRLRGPARFAAAGQYPAAGLPLVATAAPAAVVSVTPPARLFTAAPAVSARVVTAAPAVSARVVTAAPVLGAVPAARVVTAAPALAAVPVVTAAPAGAAVTAAAAAAAAARGAALEGSAVSGAFDRYGPGGLRSLDETLQGSVDCQRAGLFRHPHRCDKFYACHWDEWKGRYTLHVFNCPVHLAYDQSIGACNWPSKGPACANDRLLV